jgi:dolichol-phosphate mannosyltransferase
VVRAGRVGRNDGALRNMESAIFAWVFEMFTDLSYDSRVGPYRNLTRRVVDAYRSFNEKTRLLGGAIEWLGFPSSSVDIVQAESRFDVSGYTAGARRRLAIDAIVAYSNKPLRLSVKSGFAITTISIIAGLCLVINYFMGKRLIPGWTSIIVSIYFIG